MAPTGLFGHGGILGGHRLIRLIGRRLVKQFANGRLEFAYPQHAGVARERIGRRAPSRNLDEVVWGWTPYGLVFPDIT